MDEIKVIEIKKNVFEDNDKDAEDLRKELKDKGVFLLNLMSAPGSGKTTTLIQTLNRIKNKVRVAVQNEIVYSDEDWVIRSIEMPARLTAWKMRLAKPVRPFMPLPDTEIRAVFLRQEMPRTGPTFFSDSNGPRPILVPLASGLWLLRLHASMFFAASGASVFG